MSEVDRRIYELHRKIMNEFMGGKCYDIDESFVIDCIENVFTNTGLSIKDITLFDIDGNIVNSINNARYVRVVAEGKGVGGDQIFTLALIRIRNSYRVLYLQSAVRES
ncbi:MAG: hypothetical protein RXR44_02835 [Vulcanisaeta sp.]